MQLLSPTQQRAKDRAKNFLFPQGAVAAAASAAAANTPWPLGENIVGVGIGPKLAAGETLAGEDAVHVYVRAKIPQQQLNNQTLIPPQFGDLPTDVIEVGDVSALVLQSWQRFGRSRPLCCGVSVAHPAVTAGTLGCLVEKNGEHFLLSNNHVLANCNACALGDAALQPGTADGGVPADSIATLTDFEPLQFAGPANEMDAAIAHVGPNTQTTVEREIIDIGLPLMTVGASKRYQSVRKHGRTTGHTVGVVSALSVDLWVSYGSFGRAWFEDQISILGVGSAPFSQGGDSGSLIVDAVTREPLALLFAGGAHLTYATPLDRVLSRFGITVVG